MKKARRPRAQLIRFPLWQYFLLLSVLISSVVYALPNVYGNDPSILISNNNSNFENQLEIRRKILQALDNRKIVIKSSEDKNDYLLIRFHNVDAQFKAYNIISDRLPHTYGVSYLLASRSPDWLTSIGASPMRMGLDLQGGVRLLYEVDLDHAVHKAEERYIGEFKLALQDADIRYKNMEHFKSNRSRGISIDFRSLEDMKTGRALLSKQVSDLSYTAKHNQNNFILNISIPENIQEEIKQLALEKNISTFRNRVNELGISEPIVQKQGKDRIVVELPGVQNPEHVKDILGSTATLEFRLVYE